MKKLIVRISEGLGNQLFMYANSYALSKRLNYELFIDNTSAYLNKKKLGDILNTMAIATYKELVKAGKPVRVIYLDDDGLYPAIKLMSFFMLEVAFLGKYFLLAQKLHYCVQLRNILQSMWYGHSSKSTVVAFYVSARQYHPLFKSSHGTAIGL